jgi:hypothetical protein
MSVAAGAGVGDRGVAAGEGVGDRGVAAGEGVGDRGVAAGEGAFVSVAIVLIIIFIPYFYLVIH